MNNFDEMNPQLRRLGQNGLLYTAIGQQKKQEFSIVPWDREDAALVVRDIPKLIGNLDNIQL